MNVVSELRNDLGLWRGWAVFEAIEARGAVLFHWGDHYTRLVASCISAHIPLDNFGLSIEEGEFLKKRVIEEIMLRGYPESLIKILVTRGNSHDHKNPILGSSKVLIDILPLPLPPQNYFHVEIQEGAREFPHIKLAGGYGSTMIRKEIAAHTGFDDFLYWNVCDGISESSTGNIFFVAEFSGKNILITPAKNILFGVTRKIILDLAKKSGIFFAIQEHPLQYIKPSMFSCYQECFLTSTTIGVCPVVSVTTIDNVKYDFKTGKNTFSEKLRNSFLEYRENYFQERASR